LGNIIFVYNYFNTPDGPQTRNASKTGSIMPQAYLN